MNAHGGHTATMGIHLISAICFTSLCSLAASLFRMLVVLLFSFQAYQEWHLYFGWQWHCWDRSEGFARRPPMLLSIVGGYID